MSKPKTFDRRFVLWATHGSGQLPAGYTPEALTGDDQSFHCPAGRHAAAVENVRLVEPIRDRRRVLFQHLIFAGWTQTEAIQEVNREIPL